MSGHEAGCHVDPLLFSTADRAGKVIAICSSKNMWIIFLFNQGIKEKEITVEVKDKDYIAEKEADSKIHESSCPESLSSYGEEDDKSFRAMINNKVNNEKKYHLNNKITIIESRRG